MLRIASDATATCRHHAHCATERATSPGFYFNLGSGFTTMDRRDRRDRKVVGEKMKAKPRNC